MQSQEASAREAASKVLGGLYRAIADHSQYESLFLAWDDFLEASDGALPQKGGDWQSLFREHFTQVGDYIDKIQIDHRESPLTYVERQVVPSAVVDSSLTVIAANQSFRQVVLSDNAGVSQNRLDDKLADDKDRDMLMRLATSKSAGGLTLFSLDLGEEGPSKVLARREDLLERSNMGEGGFLSLKLIRPVWSDELMALLQSAYHLTDAEVEILKALAMSGGPQSIAEERGRSVRTVRTQLAQIFSKLGVSGQTELALFIATLASLLEEDTDKAGDKEIVERDPEPLLKKLVKHRNGQTSYAVYGDRDGIPILFIQPTNPPEMTTRFRRRCRETGLKIISPYKPGSAETTARPPKYGPEKLCLDYVDILDAEGHDHVILAGQCSGGVYALEFASRFAHRCDRVVLVDTGVPFTSRKELMALPRTMRRTFLSARYFPDVLPVPHRIIAANFRGSPAGEARVVDYFFEDSPADRDLTRTQKRFYDVTKDIIRYSMEDVDRLVADVCRWASDWSDRLTQVAASKQLIFVHGQQNTLFTTDRIEARLDSLPGAILIEEPNAGQLLLHTHTDRFIEACTMEVQSSRDE